MGIKMARSSGQSHFTGKPQSNLPDYHSRNAPSGQHAKNISSIHRNVQLFN